jgi:hypothetical protein
MNKRATEDSLIIFIDGNIIAAEKLQNSKEIESETRPRGESNRLQQHALPHSSESISRWAGVSFYSIYSLFLFLFFLMCSLFWFRLSWQWLMCVCFFFQLSSENSSVKFPENSERHFIRYFLGCRLCMGTEREFLCRFIVMRL